MTRFKPTLGIDEQPRGQLQSATAMLVVTTALSSRPEAVARARVVAERCGASFAPRGVRSLDEIRDEAGVELAYVCGARDEIHSKKERIFVQPGLFKLKRKAFGDHPLIRALGPAERPTIIDGTAGLGADALHLAEVTGGEITAVEASPAVFSILEEGLSRLSASAHVSAAAARRVHAHHNRIEVFLDALALRSRDIVYVDPLFQEPQPAVSGFEILRSLSVRVPLDRLLDAAVRVARRRVILKVPARAPAPESPNLDWVERHRGRRVDYLVASF